MTPSEAHESAYGRSPKHDQMVVEVYEHLQQNDIDFRPVFDPSRTGEKRDYNEALVECEMMYAGRRMFFSDISIVRWSDLDGLYKGNKKRYAHHTILEIKPEIYSSGALLRQLKCQKHNIDGWIKDLNGDEEYVVATYVGWSTVAAVVRHDDPNLELFMRMIEADQVVYTWDGRSLKRRLKNKTIVKKAA